MLHRGEYQQMLLAGTVSFPATFPQLGRLELRSEVLPILCGQPAEILTVTESPSVRVTLSRQVLASRVRAIFLPRDPQHVNYSDGRWLLEGEIVTGLKVLLQGAHGALWGIVFVAETEPSILNMTAGMTAGESVQYYPPLPCDPSHNHYNPHRPAASQSGIPAERMPPPSVCSQGEFAPAPYTPSVPSACSLSSASECGQVVRIQACRQ